MPEVDNVPLIVCLESNVRVLVPIVERAATSKLLYVFAPVTVFVPAAVDVNATL